MFIEFMLREILARFQEIVDRSGFDRLLKRSLKFLPSQESHNCHHSKFLFQIIDKSKVI